MNRLFVSIHIIQRGGEQSYCALLHFDKFRIGKHRGFPVVSRPVYMKGVYIAAEATYGGSFCFSKLVKIKPDQKSMIAISIYRND